MSRKYTKKQRKGKRNGRWYRPYVRATAPAVGYLAKKAAEQVVRKYINTEIKNYDKELAWQTCSNVTSLSAQTFLLNLIPSTGMEGPSQDRSGAQVKMISLEINGTILMNSSSTEDTKVKIDVWYHKDWNSATVPTYGGSYYDTTESDGTTLQSYNSINAFRNKDYTANITKLGSQTVIISPNSLEKKSFNFFIKLGVNNSGIIARWTEGNTSGALADLKRGLLTMTMLSDKTTDNYPEVCAVSRVRYIDN